MQLRGTFACLWAAPLAVASCTGRELPLAPAPVAEGERLELELVVEAAFETATLGTETPQSGDVFMFLRVTLTNTSAGGVLVSAERFAMVMSDGESAEGIALPTDGDACVLTALAVGGAITCNVIFSVDADATPSMLTFESGGTFAEAPVENVDAFGRCLLFDERIDEACFELCTLEQCFTEATLAEETCAEGCLVTCAETEDPCLCAAGGCGPACGSALVAFDACAAPCFALCGT